MQYLGVLMTGVGIFDVLWAVRYEGPVLAVLGVAAGFIGGAALSYWLWGEEE